MYAFQTNNAGRRRSRRAIRILLVLVILLTVALVGILTAFLRQRSNSSLVTEALSARAFSEADSAQSAVYRLTQSSGTNTMSLLSSIRSHIYALQCLNVLTSNIYGADNYITDPALLETCTATLDTCEAKLQAGGVLTTQFTQLKDDVDAVASFFGL